MHTIAVDWSGAMVGAEKRIWLAEAIDGNVVRLEAGRSREEVITELLTTVDRSDDTVVIGLDFSFSFPAWFLDSIGASDVVTLWSMVAVHGEAWLAGCDPPFWGRPGKSRPDAGDDDRYRVTEHELRDLGYPAKSTFQVGGAGSVGTGSIRGMPHLLTLRAAGGAIWPFDPVGRVTVAEIYPRIFTGGAVKSSEVARAGIVDSLALPDAVRTAAASSEDAFDALLSALNMGVTAPANVPDVAAREGWVWR